MPQSHFRATAFLVERWLAVPGNRLGLLVSLTALSATALLGGRMLVPLVCGTDAGPVDWDRLAGQSRLFFALNQPLLIASAWLAMVVAMMAPLAVAPLRYVVGASLATRRQRSAAAFAAGYFGCWLLAGPLLIAVAVAIRAAAPGNVAGFVLAAALALGWSAGPWSQAARNRAHQVRRIGLFGLAADLDCAGLGVRVAARCIAACWPWMVVPLFAAQGHLPAMALAIAMVVAEDLRGPSPPRWRLPFPFNLARRGFAAPGIARRA